MPDWRHDLLSVGAVLDAARHPLIDRDSPPAARRVTTEDHPAASSGGLELDQCRYKSTKHISGLSKTAREFLSDSEAVLACLIWGAFF